MRKLLSAAGCVGLILGLAMVFLGSAPSVIPVGAQTAVPRALQQGGTEQEMKDRKNAWTVGMVGGLLSGTQMRFADEMSAVLDDGDNLRILPIVSHGAASNLDDLLYLHGVDIAVTQSDVFEYFRTQRKTPNLDKRINYIIRLPIAELHILARDDVKSLEDLRGKKVNFGPAGTAASLTGTIVFQRLGIEVQEVLIDQPSALQKLKSGEVDAIARVVTKPIDFFSKIPPNSGMHFVPIPYSKMFEDYYALGEFTSQDYPTLVGAGERVDTIAVPSVLAVYNWPKGTDRFRKVERFVEALFNNWDKFQKPPFHPKWRDVNLAATVPGWTRWGVAEDMLARMSAKQSADGAQNQKQLSGDFQAYLNTRLDLPGARDPAQRDELYRDFLRWRERQGSQQGSH
jgi:TRAP-type uncharacterized transport system substrate-binding protein